jgi:hypothetical protein
MACVVCATYDPLPAVAGQIQFWILSWSSDPEREAMVPRAYSSKASHRRLVYPDSSTGTYGSASSSPHSAMFLSSYCAQIDSLSLSVTASAIITAVYAFALAMVLIALDFSTADPMISGASSFIWLSSGTVYAAFARTRYLIRVLLKDLKVSGVESHFGWDCLSDSGF